MAKKQKCMIIGASPIQDDKIFAKYSVDDCFVICADGGYETAKKFGISPDLIVGDFDSSSKKPENVSNAVYLPVKKDITDTMFAAIKGYAKGYKDFLFLGCLNGPRFDHSLANLEVLYYLLERSAVGVLADENTEILLLRNSQLTLNDMKGSIVSVFPYLCHSCTVTYKGLLYPMDHGVITAGGFVMGVSNSVKYDKAQILVHNGTAAVVLVKE